MNNDRTPTIAHRQREVAWTRRAWIRAMAGATCLGSTLRADAQSPLRRTESPKRVVILFASQGTPYANWHMKPDSREIEMSTRVALNSIAKEQWSPCLEPLFAWRHQLNVLNGLSLSLVGSYGVDAHHTGHAVALSAARPHFDGRFVRRVDGPSIDHFIGSVHSTPGPLRSLQLGYTEHAVSFDQGGLPIPSQSDPRVAYRRLFPVANGALAKLDEPQQRAYRLRLLEEIANEMQNLASRVSSADRHQLEEHHELLRDLERSLGSAVGSCSSDFLWKSEPEDPVEWTNWHARTFEDLAILALRCGHTRVVTLSDPGPNAAYLGYSGSDLHADFAHRVGLVPEADEAMTRHYRYYAARIGDIAARLADIPDGSGSLLDSTFIVLVHELGSPNHDWIRYPVITLGASDWMRVGGYYEWPIEGSGQTPRPKRQMMGRPHNQLWATIARAFVPTVEGFGATEMPDGAGNMVSLTGWMPELLR